MEEMLYKPARWLGAFCRFPVDAPRVLGRYSWLWLSTTPCTRTAWQQSVKERSYCYGAATFYANYYRCSK